MPGNATLDSKSSVAAALPVDEEPNRIPRFNPDPGLSLENDVRRLAVRVIDIDRDLASLRREKQQTFAEAKELGVDVPALKQVVRLQTTPAAERRHAEDTLNAYKRFIGLIPDFEKTPIGAHIAQAHAQEAMAKLHADPALAATASRLVAAFGSVEAARGAIEAVQTMNGQDRESSGGATVTPIGRAGGGKS